MPDIYTRTVKGRTVKLTVVTQSGQFAASADCPEGGKRCAEYRSAYHITVPGALRAVTNPLGTHLRKKHS